MIIHTTRNDMNWNSKTLLRIRRRCLRLILLISFCLFICANLALAFQSESARRSILLADSISFVTFVLNFLDFLRGHQSENALYLLGWYHLATTSALASFSILSLVWWISENKENPVGWWTPAGEFVINKAIWIFLSIQCLLLASKLVGLVVLFCERGLSGLNKAIIYSILKDENQSSSPQDEFLLHPKIFHERTFEPALLGKIRGVVVLATCLALVCYGFALMTVSALRETVVMPTQTTLAGINDPLWNDPIAPVWSAIVSIDKLSLAPGIDFGSAVNVTPLWDTEYLLPLLKDNQTLPQQCEKASEGTDPFTVHEPPLGTQYMTYICPNAFRSNISLRQWISEDIRVVTPDLLVSIDYDKLGIPLSNRLSVLHTALVSMALTDNTGVVLNSTFPYPLVSRVHTLASVYLSLRRMYRVMNMLILGVFPAYNNYFVARLDVIGPDPFAVVPSNDNTASVRLFQHYDSSDWVIVEDHRSDSIIGVFSSLGGIWTVVNGLFSLLFGGSMLIVLGVNPVSVLGLVHRIWDNTVVANLHRDFPRLKEETFPTDPKLKGVSAFIMGYIVDAGILGRTSADDPDTLGKV